METRLAPRLSIALMSVLGLALTGTAASLFYAWHTRHAMENIITRDTRETMDIVGLESALMKQRGFVAAYLLDVGNRKWLEDMNRLEPEFRSWLVKARSATRSPEERRLLTGIAEAFEAYDRKRDEVIARCDSGDVDGARRLYLSETHQSYNEVASLVAELLAVERRRIAASLQSGGRQIRAVTTLVAASMALTVVLGGVLIWFLAAGVFRPLRRMAEDVREVVAGEGEESPLAPDEVSALGHYLRTLLTSVAETRGNLARREKELHQAGKLAALGQAVAHLAHEVRNPLCTISGFARLIGRSPEASPRTRHDAEVIVRESRRLERMLTEVMDFARPSVIAALSQPLAPVVERSVLVAAGQAAEGVAIETSLDPATPEVPFDAERIEQVLINLLRNAVDASEQGGTVRIGTRPHPDGAEVFVRDEGPGIPPEVQKRIFEAFFTTKPKGNGLGLAVCREIVAGHGGRLDFQTAPDRGTTFSLVLPAGRGDNPPPAAGRPGVNGPDRQGARS